MARILLLPISVLLSCTIVAATFGADMRMNRAVARRSLAPSVKVLRYAQRVVDERDTNGDGQLDESEWSEMEGNPQGADVNRDRVVTAAEFAAYVARYGYRRKIRLMPAVGEGTVPLPSLLSPTATPYPRDRVGVARNGIQGEPNGRAPTASAAPSVNKQRIQRKYTVSRMSLPTGLPSWFLQGDRDGDGQVTLAEYAGDGSETSIREFTRYDTNGDGVVTPEECLRAPKAMGMAGAASHRAGRPIANKPDATTTEDTSVPTKRTVPDGLTKEEIKQRYQNKALLRKNQSNRPNRTNRDRSAGSE